MLGKFSKNNKYLKELGNFLLALEKLSSIASIKTMRGENKIASSILEGIEGLAKEFFILKKENPNKYHYLLEQLDFVEDKLKLNVGVERSSSEQGAGLESWFQNEEDRLNFQKRLRESNLFRKFLNVYQQIWYSAFTSQNEEISRFSIYHVEYLLAELSQEDGNEHQIEQILGFFYEVVWTIITKGSNHYKDSSIYPASISWYTNIIFDRLKSQDTGFYLGYLDLFDKYIFSTIKTIVKHGQKDIFERIISTFVDGITMPIGYPGDISSYLYDFISENEKYQEIIKAIDPENKLLELEANQKKIKTEKQLAEWGSRFEDVSRQLTAYYNEDQKKRAGDIEKKVKQNAEIIYKYNNLLDLVFATGSYCLFQKKYNFINYLFEYKQPYDSDSSWGGNDIIPSNLSDLVEYFFNRNSHERKYSFWEAHHGESIYFNQFFLLLLSRHLKIEGVNNFSLPSLHIYNLSGIEYSVKVLTNVAEGLKEQGELFYKTLGIKSEGVTTLIEEKIKPFLKNIKEQADKKIGEIEIQQTIDSEKVNLFKDKFAIEFNKHSTCRKLFKSFSLYEEKLNETDTNDDERFGINLINDKAIFFNEWHVHYGDLGESYGRDLASGEDSIIAEKISNFCKEAETIDEALGDFESDDVFILNVNIHSFTLSKNLGDSYKPKWQLKPDEQVTVESSGLYKNKIPVFNIFTSRPRFTGLLILNKSFLGKLIQYSPISTKESSDDIKDIFYFKIQDFSSNSALLNEFTAKPPTWLKDMGDKTIQEEYLMKRVLIQIFERFRFVPHEEIKGYKVLFDK